MIEGRWNRKPLRYDRLGPLSETDLNAQQRRREGMGVLREPQACPDSPAGSRFRQLFDIVNKVIFPAQSGGATGMANARFAQMVRFDQSNPHAIEEGVAPRAGAWIETDLLRGRVTFPIVAPRAGAWIETTILVECPKK